MSEREFHLPAESRGEAAGRGRLNGRRILVVGGGQTDIGEPDTPAGNGRAISILSAREGAVVAVADRNLASAEATVSLIARENGQSFAIEADVTREDDVSRMINKAKDGLGTIDGLVLNVGIGAGGAWLSGTTAESWDKVFAVNIRSHMLAVKAALPIMTSGSSIVFISSIAGLTAGSRLPAYDASKAALIGLCRHTAFEGSRRCIRANVVAPGLMDTSIGRLASRGRPNRRHHTGAARPTGNGMGDRLCGLVPDFGGKCLHYGADDRRRWRTDGAVMKFPNANYEAGIREFARWQFCLSATGRRLGAVERRTGDRLRRRLSHRHHVRLRPHARNARSICGRKQREDKGARQHPSEWRSLLRQRAGEGAEIIATKSAAKQ